MASPSTILFNPGSSPTSSASSAAPASDSSASVSSTITALVTNTASPSQQTGSFSIRFSGTLDPSSGSPEWSMSLATATGIVATPQAASSTALAARPVLDTSQVIGVSIAGGVLLLAAVGVLFFIFCAKRRKEARRNSASSFGGDEIIGGAPNIFDKNLGGDSPHPTSAQPNYVSPKAQQILGPDLNRWNLWHRAPKPQDIGLAITPRLEQGFVSKTSPASIASYQTTSRLLPDKPIYPQGQAPMWRPFLPPISRKAVPPPLPRRPVRFAGGVGLRIVNPTPTASSSNSKELRQSPHSSPESVHSGPIINRQPSDPFFRPTENSLLKPKATGLRRASRNDLPRLLTSTSQRTATGWDQSTPQSLSRPRAAYNPAEYARVMQQPSQQSVWKPAAHPTAQPPRPQRAGNNLHFPTHPQYMPYDPLAVAQEPTFNKYAPIKTLKSSNIRPLTYLTTGSETSFEDDNDGDDARISAAWP
ncbi:MAG: hypothetical protein LQ340_002977, partial [Diploschistes diacapsis]